MLNMSKEKLRAGIVGGIFVLMVGIIGFEVWPDQTTEDCILGRIKGSHTESAVNEIKAACEMKNAMKSDSLWSKFQEYLDESALANCGIQTESNHWYPPVGNEQTIRLISNLKNISIEWGKTGRYRESEISFQNNNSFAVENVMLGFIKPTYIEVPLDYVPDTKPSKFDPDKWLAERRGERKNKTSIFTNEKKCLQPEDKFEIIIECKSDYSGMGVNAGKFGQLKCNDSFPDKFKEMDACLVSVSEKKFWYSRELLKFAKSNGFCSK